MSTAAAENRVAAPARAKSLVSAGPERGELLTHGQVGAIVGLSARTVRRLWVAGQFPRPARVPGLRGWRFRRAEVLAWLAKL